MRATRSVGPPGGKPCIIVIGRSGQSGLARAGAAASIAKGPAIAMPRVNSVTRVMLRWFGVEQCRTLGVLREQTEFAAHTEFYSSEHAHKKATSCRGRGRPHPGCGGSRPGRRHGDERTLILLATGKGLR